MVYRYLQPAGLRGAAPAAQEIQLSVDELSHWPCSSSPNGNATRPREEFGASWNRKCNPEVPLYREGWHWASTRATDRQTAWLRKMQFLAEDVAAAQEPDHYGIAGVVCIADTFAPAQTGQRRIRHFSPDRRGSQVWPTP